MHLDWDPDTKFLPRQPLAEYAGCVERKGFVISLREGAEERYRELHCEVWPDVLNQIRRSNIRNYSIFLKGDLLFGYYEYVGSDHAGDMARMAEDERTQEWWKLTSPLQQPLSAAVDGEWWSEMECVFHTD